MIAEYSLPFAMAPVIVELAQSLALDKVGLQGVKLSRTAASYKMIHGLGQGWPTSQGLRAKFFTVVQ